MKYHIFIKTFSECVNNNLFTEKSALFTGWSNIIIYEHMIPIYHLNRKYLTIFKYSQLLLLY